MTRALINPPSLGRMHSAPQAFRERQVGRRQLPFLPSAFTPGAWEGGQLERREALAAGLGSGPDGRVPDTGHFESLGWMEPPGFAGREVRVFVPPRFDPKVPTPALFLFDGQNVFEGPPGQDEGWFVHR